MLKRLFLMLSLVTAIGVGVAIAGEVAQKDKAKSKEQSKEQSQTWEQKDKDKTLFAAPGVLGFEVGGAGGYLGVYLEEVTSERTKELGLKEERGAVVMKVVEDSPAAKSGLKENDVIISFNGRRVDSVRELQRLLNETPADRTVQIEVVRGGSKQTLATTLVKRSFQSFNGPGFAEQSMKNNQEAFKRAEEDFKRSQDKFKATPNFGDFTFVNPGEYGFFGGPRLGITAESLTPQLAEFFGVKDGKGVLVASVEENSVGAKAGIKAGDVVIGVDNEMIDGVRAMSKALSTKGTGTVVFKIVRNRAEQTINVTLEKREPLMPRRRAVITTRPLAIV